MASDDIILTARRKPLPPHSTISKGVEGSTAARHGTIRGHAKVSAQGQTGIGSERVQGTKRLQGASLPYRIGIGGSVEAEAGLGLRIKGDGDRFLDLAPGPRGTPASKAFAQSDHFIDLETGVRAKAALQLAGDGDRNWNGESAGCVESNAYAKATQYNNGAVRLGPLEIKGGVEYGVGGGAEFGACYTNTNKAVGGELKLGSGAGPWAGFNLGFTYHY